MKVLTIQRSKWRRGGNSSTLIERFGPTRLLNERGFMCCLGFDAHACGISDEALLDMCWPQSLRELAPDWYCATRLTVGPAWADYELLDNAIVQQAMKLNDDADMEDAVRERALVPLLKRLGWDDVVFVD